VAEGLVLFVFGRWNTLWGLAPSGGWLSLVLFVFGRRNEVWHLVAGGWIWRCLLLAGHVMNCGGWSDLYKKGENVKVLPWKCYGLWVGILPTDMVGIGSSKILWGMREYGLSGCWLYIAIHDLSAFGKWTNPGPLLQIWGAFSTTPNIISFPSLWEHSIPLYCFYFYIALDYP